MNQIKKWKKINIACIVLYAITFIILFAYIGYSVSLANSTQTSDSIIASATAFVVIVILISFTAWGLCLALLISMLINHENYGKKYKTSLLVAGILMIFFGIFVNFYCCSLFNKMLNDNEINSPTPSDPQNTTNTYFYDNN